MAAWASGGPALPTPPPTPGCPSKRLCLHRSACLAGPALEEVTAKAGATVVVERARWLASAPRQLPPSPFPQAPLSRDQAGSFICPALDAQSPGGLTHHPKLRTVPLGRPAWPLLVPQPQVPTTVPPWMTRCPRPLRCSFLMRRLLTQVHDTAEDCHHTGRLCPRPSSPSGEEVAWSPF